MGYAPTHTPPGVSTPTKFSDVEATFPSSAFAQKSASSGASAQSSVTDHSLPIPIDQSSPHPGPIEHAARNMTPSVTYWGQNRPGAGQPVALDPPHPDGAGPGQRERAGRR